MHNDEGHSIGWTGVPPVYQKIPLIKRIEAAVRAFSVSKVYDREEHERIIHEVIQTAINGLDDMHKFNFIAFLNNLPSEGSRVPSDLDAGPFVAAIETIDDALHQVEVMSHVCRVNKSVILLPAVQKWVAKNGKSIAVLSKNARP